VRRWWRLVKARHRYHLAVVRDDRLAQVLLRQYMTELRIRR
jgi:hypothetical protein